MLDFSIEILDDRRMISLREIIRNRCFENLYTSF